MKKCPYCSNEIPEATNFCRYCGKDLRISIGPKQTIAQKQFHNPITITTKKKTNLLIVVSILIGLCGFSFFCYLLGILTNNASDQIATESANTSGNKDDVDIITLTPTDKIVSERTTNTSVFLKTLSPTITKKMTPSPSSTQLIIETNIRVLMDGAGLTKEEAEKAFEIINSVGFEKVEVIEYFLEEDNINAYLADFGYSSKFLVTISNGEILEISRDNALVLYDRNAGGVLDNINYYVLSSLESSTFMYLAEESVKLALKAPSTADFPGHVFEGDQWNVSRQKDIVTVQSWVDSSNSFGAVLRTNFTVQLSYTTETLLYLELGGKVVYGSFQKP